MVNAGPLQNIDVANAAVDVDRDGVVLALDDIELRMHQSLIQIKDKRLPSAAVFGLRAD